MVDWACKKLQPNLPAIRAKNPLHCFCDLWPLALENLLNHYFLQAQSTMSSDLKA